MSIGRRTGMKKTKFADCILENEFFISADEPVFTSGVVCELLSVPIWVLKQLDSEGIVSPPRKHENQSRLYSKRELKKLDHVWYLMSKRKVKVDGIKVILEMETNDYNLEK